MYNKRYLPHTLDTRFYAVSMFLNCSDFSYVIRKYHISKSSLYRWIKKFDGNKESLADISHKPKTIHPNSHTAEEITNIKKLLKRNSHITLNELYYKLKLYYNYQRHIGSLYKFLRKNNLAFCKVIKGTSKRPHNKKYDTPTKIGVKWQIDVKFVPDVCKSQLIPFDMKFYQYTCIDEASRKRFLYWYNEHSPANTVDFVQRCIKFFHYQPLEIQTDNGVEFTYNRFNVKKEHPLDILCNSLNIFHHTIRPRTPEHNGKVERSHRNDNERFYSYLKFFNLIDLRKQGAKYLYRSNNIPMSVLNYLTPNQKELELLQA